MEFEFGVLDEATAPFKAMDAAMGHLIARLESAGHALEHFEQGLKTSGHASGEGEEAAEGFFEALVGADVVERVGDALKELGEKVLELGEEFIKTGLEMADFRNGAVLSIKAITDGTDDEADEFLETLERMARGTHDTGDQMFAAFQRMGAFTKQFGKKATTDVLAGIQDINVAFGKGAGDAVLNAIQNAQAMGKFDERALRGLKESGVATPERLLAVLAERQHKSVAQIDALLKAGKISAAEGTNAILSLIRKDLDKGGALGELSKKGADQSFGVQVKNFKERVEDLFERVDTKPLVDAMAKLGALFDPNTERGKKLEQTIDKIFKALGDLVSWVTEGHRLEEIFDSIGKYAEMAWPLIKGLGIVFGAVVGVFAAGAALFAAPFVALDAAILYVIGSLGTLWQKGKEIGGNFLKGLREGIKAGWDDLVNLVKNLGHAIVGGVKSVLKIQSPSRVMFEMGAYTAEGMQLGLEARIPRVQAAMTDVMLPTPKFASAAQVSASIAGTTGTPELALPATGAGGGARAYHAGDIYLDLHLGDAAAAAAHDPRELAELVIKEAQEKLQPMVRAEVVKFIEDDAIAN